MSIETMDTQSEGKIKKEERRLKSGDAGRMLKEESFESLCWSRVPSSDEEGECEPKNTRYWAEVARRCEPVGIAQQLSAQSQRSDMRNRWKSMKRRWWSIVAVLESWAPRKNWAEYLRPLSLVEEQIITEAMKSRQTCVVSECGWLKINNGEKNCMNVWMDEQCSIKLWQQQSKLNDNEAIITVSTHTSDKRWYRLRYHCWWSLSDCPNRQPPSTDHQQSRQLTHNHQHSRRLQQAHMQ